MSCFKHFKKKKSKPHKRSFVRELAIPMDRSTDCVMTCICSLGNRLALHSPLTPALKGLCKGATNKRNVWSDAVLGCPHRITIKLTKLSPTLLIESSNKPRSERV